MDFSSPPGRELQGVIIKRDALEDTGIFPASYIWVLNLSLVRRGFEQRKEAIMLSVHPLHIREDYKTKKKNIGYSELYLDSSVGSGCRQLDTFASICFVSVAMDSFSPPKMQERYQRFFYEPSFYKRDKDSNPASTGGMLTFFLLLL